MNKKSTAPKGAILAAVSVYLSPMLGLTPELAAIAVLVIGAVLLTVIPDDVEAQLIANFKKLAGYAPAFLAVVMLAGCTTTVTIPSWDADQPFELTSSILDRAPGDDQQTETSSLTGLGLLGGNIEIGIGSRGVSRNPVSENPLHAAPMRTTTAVVSTGGAGLDTDITLGDAFAEDGVTSSE